MSLQFLILGCPNEIYIPLRRATRKDQETRYHCILCPCELKNSSKGLEGFVYYTICEIKSDTWAITNHNIFMSLEDLLMSSNIFSQYHPIWAVYVIWASSSPSLPILWFYNDFYGVPPFHVGTTTTIYNNVWLNFIKLQIPNPPQKLEYKQFINLPSEIWTLS